MLANSPSYQHSMSRICSEQAYDKYGYNKPLLEKNFVEAETLNIVCENASQNNPIHKANIA
jgi:hypothetical protein